MARFHLRLSDEEFFCMTPRQLHVLTARHHEQTEHQEFLSAIVASTIANFSLAAPKKPLKPSDFMPSLRAKQGSSKKTRMPRKAIAQNVRCMLLARMQVQAQGS